MPLIRIPMGRGIVELRGHVTGHAPGIVTLAMMDGSVSCGSLKLAVHRLPELRKAVGKVERALRSAKGER